MYKKQNHIMKSLHRHMHYKYLHFQKDLGHTRVLSRECVCVSTRKTYTLLY